MIETEKEMQIKTEKDTNIKLGISKNTDRVEKEIKIKTNKDRK